VLALAAWLQHQGVAVTILGVDGEGRLDLAELEAALRPDTGLVSVMAANNETGVRFPLEDVARIVKARGILLHVDGTQAVGKVPLDLAGLPVDLFNLSGHKFHGPKGTGALYLRRGVRIKPFMLGGGQERGRRGGTENVPGLVGLGVAAELARAALGGMARVEALRDGLEAALLERVPGVHLNGTAAPRLPNTSMVSFAGVEGEDLLLKLNEHGICASLGSACTTGQKEPSHVLRAMGVERGLAMGSLRFSFSRFTTGAEVERLEKLLPELVAALRR
jgi:cysteine desulfurase